MKNIITFLSTILLLITLFFILKHYYFHYINYMFNMNKNWNKHIEKPRLAIYTITIPMLVVLFIEINNQEYDLLFLNFLKASSIIILFLLMNIITLTFLKKSAIIRLTPTIQRNKLFKNDFDFESLIKDDDELIESSFKYLNNLYFKGNINSYKSFISHTPLKSNQHKLIWISREGKKIIKRTHQTLDL